MRELITLGIAACCLWNIIPAQAAVSGAPAPPTEVVAHFPDGSLEGYVNFMAPKTTVGGQELTGNINYNITLDGSQLSKGQVYPGVSKSVDVVMKKKGVYTFTITLSNEAGESEPVSYTAGAGYSPAVAPAPKAALQQDGSVKISWNAVTETMAGGSLKNEEVTYLVYRYPDNHLVTRSTPELSVIDNDFDGDLHAYRYFVCAFYNATPGEEGYTSPVVVGSTKAPFSTNWGLPTDFDLWQKFDLDNDGRCWEYYGDQDDPSRGEITANVSSDRDADDWLISPGIVLNKGSFHPVAIDLRVRDKDYPGTIELCYGPDPNPEAMTHKAIDVTEFDNGSYKTFTGIAVADWYGPVYFGLHNMTKADMWWVYATNFKVDASAESKVPAAPTDFRSQADINGRLEIVLSLTAPSKDISGDPIEENINKIDLFRDGHLIHTFTDVKPGEELSYTDIAQNPDPVYDSESDTEEETPADKEDTGDLTDGEHIYSVAATNRYGLGMETKLNAYVGFNYPATPAQAWTYEGDKNGIMVVEWEPVTTYIDGTPLNPENVTYSVWTSAYGEYFKIGKDISGTSFTDRIVLEGEEQVFFQFGVTAQIKGRSDRENLTGAMTEMVPFGEPYPTPYEDSFVNLQANYSYVKGNNDGSSFWDFASDNRFEDVQSQDGDNGMLFMYGEYLGSQAILTTGKIDLKGMQNPMLTFYVFNLGDAQVPDTDTMEVLAEIGKGEYKSLGSWVLDELGPEGWHRISVPLDEFKDGSVRLRFVGTVNAYQYLHLDNIQIRSRRNYDLSIDALSVPERIKSGNQCPVIVSYANHGLNDAGEFSIEVLRDGKVVNTKTIAGLNSDAKGEVTLPVLHNAVTPEEVTYEVRLNYAPDQVPADNVVSDILVKTISPAYPVVTDLAAHFGDNPNEIGIVWSEPDLSGAFEDDVVENFEAAKSWSSKLDGWTFIDIDRQHIYGFEPWIVLPEDAPKAMSRQSWWICDASYEPMVEHYSDPRFYKAHSGNKYMISMAVTDDELTSVRSDDWAISPELPGIEQTISLWAKSMLQDAPETFEMLYSTSDTDLDSFETLQIIKEVGWDWTQYFFDLPEGTKYFAIRCISRDQYVLMIDDINYIPEGKGADLKVAGYNVYRDKELLNETPLTSRRYDDVRSDAAVQNVYNVTALYEGRGESALSNDATPSYSGVGSVLDAVRVSGGSGVITVDGAEGAAIRVFAADGSLTAAREGESHTRISVPAGVYLVNIAGATWKVIIR